MKTYRVNKMSHAVQAGFTLIELVIVIVILGILAATALPRFFDVTTDARKAVVAGVSGSFATGIAMNHAKWLVDGSAQGSPAGCTIKGTATVPDTAAVAPVTGTGSEANPQFPGTPLISGTGTGCTAGTSAVLEGQTVGYNAFGYPASDNAAPTLVQTSGLVVIDDDMCVKLWNVVLASGRPSIATAADAKDPTKTSVDWSAAATTVGCTFSYHGGARLPTARKFIYDQSIGSIALTNA